MTRGEVSVTGINPAYLEIALDKVVSAGGDVATRPDGFSVRMDRRPTAIDILTLPYPGFPTDLLPMAIGRDLPRDARQAADGVAPRRRPALRRQPVGWVGGHPAGCGSGGHDHGRIGWGPIRPVAVEGEHVVLARGGQEAGLPEF
jgi:hypothetical protein